VRLIKRFGWLSAVAFGVAFLVLGTIFVVQGNSAKALIRSEMADEAVTTGKDASIPNAPVLDAQTAQVEADVIKEHTWGTWGPYSKMAREDPNRDTYLKGLTIRNSLSLSIMGFGVADMAVGVGGITILLGLMSLGLLAPALYAVGKTATQPAVQAAPVRAGSAAASAGVGSSSASKE